MTNTTQPHVHTAGPWKLDGGIGKKGERYIWTDRDEDGKGYIGTHEVCVAIVGGKRNMRESREAMATIEEIILADAHLVKAAPKMLAALIEADNRFSYLDDADEMMQADREVWQQIKDAISEARGI